jgi:RND family efflux transporter MFP subunit
MKYRTISILVLAIILTLGCTKKEELESNNMEQIYKEFGVPVEISKTKPASFFIELPFSATLTNLYQSSASAMIGGRIEKVLVKVGDYVEKDQVLITFPEDAPAAQYKQAKAGFELAKSTYDRMKNLYEIGGISLQDLESVQTQYKVAAANFDASSQMLKVRAPISGYVTAVNVRETESVRAETQLVTIAQRGKMKARIWANEAEIYQIKRGQKATAIWKDKEIIGEVVEVSSSKDMMRMAFDVDLVFDDKDAICKSGVIADIKIHVYENPTALLVPRKIISTDEKGKFVFVVNNDKAEKRYIKIGEENDYIEVLSGLNINDAVVVKGYNKLSNGMKVKVIR